MIIKYTWNFYLGAKEPPNCAQEARFGTTYSQIGTIKRKLAWHAQR